MKKINWFLILLLFGCAHERSGLYQVDPQFEETKSNYEARASKMMIASQGPHATKAGLKISELGGNIFDVFVAVSFVIAVERPHSTGLGGGGFLVASGPLVKKPIAVDFREIAPKGAQEKMFLNEKGEVIKNLSVDGIKAVGVPGMVAGVLELHQKYGSLPLKLLLSPAIDLALKGFPVYPHLAQAIIDRAEVLKKYGGEEIYFRKNGSPLVAGDILIQKDLAKTLMQIASYGRAGFYEGKIADSVVKTSQELGGVLNSADLLNYKVKFRNPIVGTYHDYELVSMPPPSSGGAHVIEILNIIENDDLTKFNPQDPHAINLIASAMQLAFADRAEFMGDADFVSVPLKKITSKKYAKELRSKILYNKVLRSKNIRPKNKEPEPMESNETTHFTIMDNLGNTIVSTQTINGDFGSAVVVSGTGIVLNNEMDDFAPKVGASNLYGAIGGKNNLVAPLKRPLSSMTPTIVLKNKVPVLALGTPSGTRIITCVTNVILNYLDFKLPLYESVAATRFHHQWYPEEIRIDTSGFPKPTIFTLELMGHKINEKNLGCQVQAVSLENDQLHGVSDPRGEGLALGIN